MTTKLTLILAMKSDSMDTNGFTRLTFYKNPEAAKNPMGVAPQDAGALDMMIPTEDAAAYKTSNAYVVTITAPVSLGLAPITNVAKLNQLDEEEEGLPLP